MTNTFSLLYLLNKFLFDVYLFNIDCERQNVMFELTLSGTEQMLKH